ncbi:hypothetical protein C2S51_027066 [Perilla frutescens var. frutescens]|nr:hypothetical protein C2S51_027066 [Perilla frutescens var. frutescens]
MKINRISKKLIKPHTPTPQNLKNHNISFLDKFMEPTNFAVVLFYELKPENKSHLEESLSKILVKFYPLAGRYIKNEQLFDCSDQGAEFVEAEALEIELIDLVVKIDTDQLNDLLPEQYFKVDEASHDPVLSIQATHFRCGGVAIALSVSHRVFDAASLGTFVAAWSNSSNPDSDSTITPSFDLPSLIPNKYHDFGVGSTKVYCIDDNEIVVKRFLFNKEALTRLTSKLRPNMNGKNISAVRVVCAVIAKALIRLDRAKHGGRNRDVVITQPINMRERTILPQPKHCCGNLFLMAASKANGVGMQELVDVIGDSVRKSIANYAEIVSPDDRDGRGIIINTFRNFVKQAWNPETNTLVFSDWSKFGFYEADFGFGKPVLTSIGPQRRLNGTTLLMSDREGDGIDAWVHLKRNDMRCFEQDDDISNYSQPS